MNSIMDTKRDADAAQKTLNSDEYLRLYRQMARIRAFEDNANQLYLSAKMPGLTL